MLSSLALVVAIAAVLIAVLPVEWLLPPGMRLDPHDRPRMYMSELRAFNGSRPTDFLGAQPKIEVGPLGFMLVITPAMPLSSNKDKEGEGASSLISWYMENLEWINEMTHTYGGLLLRGFDVDTPQDFDAFLISAHPDLEAGVYLGTTPRFPIAGTKYVQSASEAPRIISIPTHIELSFTPSPPKRIYFYAHEVNPAPGGHTPFTDFRAVWEQLDPSLKEKIETRGWLYERWYFNRGNARTDVLKSKPWQDMFRTENRSLAIAMAAEQEFNATFDEKTGDIALRHYAVISRTNAATGRDFWCTHFNVLHAPTFAVPFAWDAQLFRSKITLAVTWLMHIWVQGRHALGYRYGHNTYWADDESEIEWDDAMNIRRLISRNTWSFPYERGDLVVLDNHRTAHGRTPWYNGKRSVMVAYK